MRQTDAAIQNWFIGYALDRIEGPRSSSGTSQEAPFVRNEYRDRIPNAQAADHAMEAYRLAGEWDDCVGCSCHLSAPCHHCENEHDEDDGVTC